MRTPPLLLAAALAALLTACGQQEAAAPAAPPAPAAPAAAPAPVAQNSPGESTYKKTCALCHSAGVAGAPRLGDKADWGPRIAQGTEVLYKHSIEGFTGQKGMMPPRGGAATLSDDDLKAAVDYMVAKAN